MWSCSAPTTSTGWIPSRCCASTSKAGRVPPSPASGSRVRRRRPSVASMPTSRGRIREFVEKPADPPGTPDDPEQTFVSMGNYIFTTKVLIDAIRADAEDDHSDHDMGGDIIPRLVSDGMAAVYDFNDNEVPGATERDHGYWRDVGTLDAFYDAHMDLVSVHPIFNLYNKRWPIRGGARRTWPRRSSSTAGRPRNPSSARAASFRRPRCVIRCCRPTSPSTTAPSSRAAC